MKKSIRPWWLIVLLLGLAVFLALSRQGTSAEGEPLPPLITGKVIDGQDQPVNGADVTLHTAQDGPALAEAVTQHITSNLEVTTQVDPVTNIGTSTVIL